MGIGLIATKSMKKIHIKMRLTVEGGRWMCYIKVFGTENILSLPEHSTMQSLQEESI